MGNTYLCIGDDPTSPTAFGNTCMLVPIHEGGFIEVESLPAGRYLFLNRRDVSNYFNLSAVRAYQSQNLLAYAPTIISDIVPVNRFEIENLTSNLGIRTTRYGDKPTINANGDTTSDYRSCFKFALDDQDFSSATDPFFAMTFHFAEQVFVNALLLVNDLRWGKLGDRTATQNAKFTTT